MGFRNMNLDVLIKILLCHRNVLRHFLFKLYLTGKPYKFGVQYTLGYPNTSVC